MDDKPSLLQADPAQPTAGSSPTHPKTSEAPQRTPHPAGSPAALLVALLALAATGWQAWDHHQQLQTLQARLTPTTGETAPGLRPGSEADGEWRERLAAVEARLASSEEQRQQLEALNRDLGRSREERLLSEAEQAVAIASQQLELTGNIDAALHALEAAESRLAQSTDPRLLPLRRALTGDVERLRSLPQRDLAGAALRLDALIADIDRLPLAFAEQPAADAPPASDKPAQGWLAQLLGDIWRDLHQLVRIERIDGTQPALLAPQQGIFLRENLKLRLLNARLALLQHDPKLYQEDLRQAGQWLEQYFAHHDAGVSEAVALLKRLRDTPLADTPRITETQQAFKALRDPGTTPEPRPGRGKDKR